MNRGGPLKQRSDKRVAEDREREKAKVVVRQRARGGCEAAPSIAMLYGHDGCAGPFDFHEVLTRARGGSITDPTNILMVCRKHHDWITTHPEMAAAVSLVRNSWEDPGPKLRPVPRPTPGTGLRAANVRSLSQRTGGIQRTPERQVTTHPAMQPSDDLLTLKFAYPVRPWTLNGERKMTPYGRAAKVKEWKDAWTILGHASPRLAWCDVEVHVYLRDMRDQDTVGAVSAYKAAQDGLVAAGVLPADDSDHVRSVRFYPPHKKTYDALELVLTGEPA